MTRRLPLMLAVLALALVAAPAAQAATPFTVGTGVRPKIVVSANGTGHVVWAIPADGLSHARIGYCRLPAGASACDRQYELSYPPSSGQTTQSQGNVTVHALSDSAIRIVGSCYQCGGVSGAVDRIYRFSSNDGGATAFGAPFYMGSSVTTSGLGADGLLLPTDVYVAPAEGDQVIARPGVPDSAKAEPVTGFLFVYSPSIVQVPGQNKLVYAVNDLGVVKAGVYSGPNLLPATMMTQGNWTQDILLPSAEPDSSETHLNSGPSGVWLTYRQSIPQNDHLFIRGFNATTNAFGSPRAIESSSSLDAGIDYPSSSQDATGRVHAVWRTLYDTNRLRYTRSDPTGATFDEPANIAQGEFFLEPEVAAAPDGTGWAIWTSNGSTPVRAVRLERYPEPGPTPTPPPAAAPTPPAPTAPAVLPVGRSVRSSVPGASIDFGLPKGCVQPGQTFRVTLKWKRKKKKGNKFVKVTRADFYIGTKVVKKDKKAPFVQTLRVTASAGRGSTIKLRARAYIKVKRGKSPKKSIRATIKVCL